MTCPPTTGPVVRPYYPTSTVAQAPRPYVAPAPVAVAALPAAAPASAPLLPPIVWESATRVDLGTAPLIVWIGEGTSADEVARERLVFGVPKTSLGSHAFRLLRVSVANAAKDPRLLAWAGFTGPTMVAIAADGSMSRAIAAGSMVPRTVWAAMKEVAAATFKDDLEAVVVAARKNLEESERLDAERREMAFARLAETERQTRLAAINRRRAELETQLQSLWTLHPRKSA